MCFLKETRKRETERVAACIQKKDSSFFKVSLTAGSKMNEMNNYKNKRENAIWLVGWMRSNRGTGRKVHDDDSFWGY